MAKAGAASALTDALARLPAEENPALLAAVADTLKHTAVNDDICKEVAERGGLTRAFDLLRERGGGDAGAARSTAALARQLLGSDANKAAATRAGGHRTHRRAKGSIVNISARISKLAAETCSWRSLESTRHRS